MTLATLLLFSAVLVLVMAITSELLARREARMLRRVTEKLFIGLHAAEREVADLRRQVDALTEARR